MRLRVGTSKRSPDPNPGAFYARVALSWLFLGAVMVAGTAIAAAKPAATGQFAEINDDLWLHYEDVGQGQVMVWVPGWVATTEVFSKQIEHFSKNYRVITFDPRSVGLSTKTLDHNNYIQHGRDLAALMDKLALNDVILVGWSWGCLDSYAYIRTKGVSNLKAFMCIDSSPKPFSGAAEDWADWTGTDASIADQRKLFYAIESGPEAFFSGFAAWLNGRDLTSTELSWFTRQVLLTPTYVMEALFFDAHFSDYVPEVKELDGKIPVLNIVREENAAKARSFLSVNAPHSKTFVIKRHMSFWSDPDSFNAGVDAFLAEVK